MEKIYEVLVKPNAKIVKITKLDDKSFEIHLKSQPIKGAANKELIILLSKHFKIPKSSVEIIKGMKSKKKLVKIHLTES